jgi:hypothetical protein
MKSIFSDKENRKFLTGQAISNLFFEIWQHEPTLKLYETHGECVKDACSFGLVVSSFLKLR